MFDFRSSAFLRKLLQQSGESEQETPSGSGGWGGLPRGFLDYLAPRSLPLPGPRVAPNATVPLEVPVGPEAEAEAWLRQLEKLKGKDIDDLSGTEYGRMREEERKGAENWRDLPERPPAQDIEGEEYHRKRREEIERGARGLAGDVLGRPDPSEIVDVEGEEFHRKQRELLRPTPAGGDPFAPEAGDVVTARVPVGRGAEVLTDQDVVEHGVEAVSGPYKDTMRQLLEFLTQEGGFAGFAHATQAISDIARREQLAEQIVRTLADPLGLVPAADQGIEPYFRDVAKLLDPSNTTTTAFTFTGSTRFPDFIVVGPNTTIPDYLARALQAYHLAMGTVTNPQDPFGTRPDTTARAGLTHELLHAIAAARARQLGIQSRNPLDEYYVLHDPIIGGIDDLAY